MDKGYRCSINNLNTCWIYVKMSDSVKNFYSSPSQYGGGLPVFTGSRRQIGGSFLSGLARFAMPILKFLGGRVLNVAKNVANDVIMENKPVKSSLKEHGLNEIKKVLTGRGSMRAVKRINMRGGGVHRKTAPINNSKRIKLNDIFKTK